MRLDMKLTHKNFCMEPDKSRMDKPVKEPPCYTCQHNYYCGISGDSCNIFEQWTNSGAYRPNKKLVFQSSRDEEG